mmetsp:Transcript_13027/g.19885  ORF Transcript_13027/g.19885 Transcript_13027/m.19885 type:complete len:577 (+) Transcript_13027:95-1825(+)
MSTQSNNRIKVLTVGDGDLTLSLAVIRAYGSHQIDLTASTLLSSAQELATTYQNSPQVLEELKERQVKVLFGVDATQLHETDIGSFDCILFHHPHLGLETLSDSEAFHAERHYQLLVHYLWSARQCLSTTPSSFIHLCLCGCQDTTWRLLDAAKRSHVTLVKQYDTTTPLSAFIHRKDTVLQELKHETNYSAPRRYRNGKLGSKHYLGKFGYQHRPTHPATTNDVNVANSQHFIFQPHTPIYNSDENLGENDCHICGASFDDPDSLTKHMKAPALPTKPPRPPRPAIAVKAGDNLEPDNKKIKVAVSEGPVLWSGKVEESSDGQRLRYFIRQQSVQLSKKKAEQHIQNGCVLLNAEVLFDSSRILRYKDEVELRQFEISTANSVSPSVVDIVHQEADWVVGWKPVGIRTQGAFSEQTMESLVSKQLGGVYESLSKMDTGCGGLCVFWRKADDNVSSKPLVMHEYTALVHGYVEWKEHSLVLEPARRWKTKAESNNLRSPELAHNLNEGSGITSEPSGSKKTLCTLICHEKSNAELVSALSTLVISARSNTRVDEVSEMYCILYVSKLKLNSYCYYF